MKSDKIYLVGFMGAGKSTVARALAQRLRWSVEDLDELIETQEQRTIAEIFSTEGEAEFRKMEQALLQELRPRRHVVVATGGGTFVDPASRALIASDGTSVWLDVSFETVVKRLPSDGTRPLATDRSTMHELWRVRRPVYSLAELKLSADRTEIEDLVGDIVSCLES